MFISYFEKHHRKINKKYAIEMCNISDKECEAPYSCFREWLVGSNFKTEGNLKMYKKWKYNDFYDDRIRY